MSEAIRASSVRFYTASVDFSPGPERRNWTLASRPGSGRHQGPQRVENGRRVRLMRRLRLPKVGSMKRLIKNKMSFWLGCFVVPLGLFQCVAHFSIQGATTLLVGVALILLGTHPIATAVWAGAVRRAEGLD